MASSTVTHQPGISAQKEYSGSVGGYIGGYTGDEDVFIHEKRGAPDNIPIIPMGLEVFERVSKLVAHQVVSNDESKLGLVCNFVLFSKCCSYKAGYLMTGSL